jgi:CTP synthase
VDNIYRLPQVFHEQDLDDRILGKLGIWAARANLEKWEQLIERCRSARRSVRIAIVGKYVHLADTYKSLNEALSHGAIANGARVELMFVDSETIDPDDPGGILNPADGVLVPGGFGERGAEGKIAAIQWARENRRPFFGICLGMQLAVIEFARHVLGLRDADSREFSESTEHTVVDLMDDQRNVTDKGGTMRLGSFPCVLDEGSTAARVYRSERVEERHRHRYEVNPEYHERLSTGGMRLSGKSPDGRLVEMVELPDHPYFVACQFHPEFKSRPLAPHPLFKAFIRASLQHREDDETPVQP